MDAIMAKDEKVFVNTQMETDLVKKLDAMAAANEQTRAGLIRLLVKKAWKQHQAEQNIREALGVDVLTKKVRNGKKAIKTIKAEQS